MKTILLTNDDSIYAKGLKSLAESLKGLGKLYVVAPNKPQSGMGHAITIGIPLRLEKIQFMDNVEAFACSGTPADCVKLGVDKVLKMKPDLCVSGINHGPNHAINVLYSGTMSAAIEASIERIPSIGISLLDYDLDADFSEAQTIAFELAQKLLKQKNNQNICLNVNVPKKSKIPLKGFKICRQANAKYDEDFLLRKDPAGHEYFWMSGVFKNQDIRKDTDVYALEHHYASIVPVSFDLTNEPLKKKLTTLWKS
ncbi:MAG: 5'/3'-nucleotidase SurE [Alphaproteobacteria bacterium]|nr:5'/3'-nucleotidase SurE [Alphaproteobacteria bacterium]